jgi:hypothetical protein
MSDTAAPDPARCPLCGGPNQCAMAAGSADEPCWCTRVTFTAQALEAIPPPLRGVACVCPACAARLAGGTG